MKLTRVASYFDVRTPGAGLMTINENLWGNEPKKSQLKILNRFNDFKKIEGAFHIGKCICMLILTGIINHMAPAGKNHKLFKIADNNSGT